MTTSAQIVPGSKRLIDEHLSQIFSVIVSLLDRVVLTAVLYRVWDKSTFEVWSACIAAAALISLFEFGFNLYFNNRLMIEMESGNSIAATQTYFLSNTILGISGFLGPVVLFLYLFLFSSGSDSFDGEAGVVLLILSIGGGARIAVSGAYSLYRANRQYARLVKILGIGELLRITSAIVVLIFDGGMIAVSAVSTAVHFLITVIFILLDTNRRFHPHAFRFLYPRWQLMREGMSMSSAFYAQMLSMILLTSVPVLILNYHNLAVGALAAFVLLRTLAGLSRTPLQALGVVFGQECGRRLALREHQGAFLIFSVGARLFAALSGLATGFLLFGGSQLVELWTGDASVFDTYLFLAALTPMVLVSTSILAHNVLIASNAPYFAAVGRWSQVAITGLVFAFIPLPDLALRMMLALAIGEILGFAPLAYLAVARIIPNADWLFQIKQTLIALLAMIFAAIVTIVLTSLAAENNVYSVSLGLVLSLLTCLALLPWLAFNQQGRQRLLNEVILPFVGKSSFANKR